MAKLPTISPSSEVRTRLNNTEYTDFSVRVRALIELITLIVLKIPQEIYELYVANVEKMRDIVNHTTANANSATLAQLDVKRDTQVVYFFNTLRAMLGSPFEDQKSAAERVYAVVKSYSGMQRLPNRQETTKIEGMLLDLEKDNLPTDINVLGLAATLKELNFTNAQYRDLTDIRARELAGDTLEAGKKIRIEMDEQYDTMMAYAQAAAILNPSPETEKFVASLNQIILETKSTYRQRTAKHSEQPDINTPEPDEPDGDLTAESAEE